MRNEQLNITVANKHSINIKLNYMIKVIKYKAEHQLRTNWNKYAKDKQYSYAICDCFCVYFMGILVYKRIDAPK